MFCHRSWMSKYHALVEDSSRLKKVKMTDYNRFTSVFDSDELTDYLRLTGSLGEIAVDEQVFDIVTLVSLFSDVTAASTFSGSSNVEAAAAEYNSGAKRFVSDLRNKYLTVLRRKLKSQPERFSKINVGLFEIDHLATILKKLSV